MRRHLLLFLAVGAAYAVGSQLAFSWFGADGATSSFFPAAGVTIAALVLVPRRRWPTVLAAAALAELTVDLAHGIGLAPTAGYVVANTVQPLVGALLLGTLRRGRIDLAQPGGLLAFLACAVVAAPAVGAVLGATTFTLLDGGSGWGRFAGEWWVGDGLGVLVIGGAILSHAADAGVRLEGARLREAVALGAGAVLATVALFWGEWLPLAYVPVALLIVSGFRAGTRAVALTGALVAVIAAEATASGHTFWEMLDVTPATGLLYLQLAIAVVLASALGLAAEVSERERAATGLAAAERFRELADTAPAMLWVADAGRRCTFLSRGWYEHTGMPPGSGLGAGRTEAIHPDDRDRADAAFAEAAARGEPFAVDYRLRTADGGHRWAIDSGRPRRDDEGALVGWVGSVIDAHERTRADEALRESEGRLRALFSSIDEGYCLCRIVLDAEGRPADYLFIETNPLFEEMTGLRNAAGRTALALLPGLEHEWVERYGRVALEGEPTRFESGSDVMGRWFDVFATPVDPPGHFALVFKDVTERRRAEEALRASEAAERGARARAELVTEVVRELEGLEGFAERAARLLDLLVPRMADFATVETPGGARPVVAAAHRDPGRRHLVEALRTRHRPRPGDPAGRGGAGDRPAGDALEPGLVAGPAAHPDGRRPLEALAPRSHMAVSLDVGAGPGATLLLGLSDPGRPVYTADDLAFARTLGDAVGVLLARARVQEEEHRVALGLQRALLPDALDPDPRVTVGARYAPAGGELEVGGDWYDAFALPDGRIGLAVGDVVGHGLEAAADMGGLRIALAALAPHASGPAELLTLLDDFAAGPNGTSFATVCYAILDPATGTLIYASAGHPPTLVVSPAGETTWLDGAASIPLCGMQRAQRPEASVVLPPGALLIMYSDGLIERRRQRLEAGMERLAAIALEARGGDVGEVCDVVMGGMMGDVVTDDDAVVLCLRLAPRAARRFHRRFPARPAELRRIRETVREWLDEEPLEVDRVGLLLALGEACSNAVEHAYWGRAPGEVEVEIEDGAGDLAVRVRDFGRWRPPSDDPRRGRGTDIIMSVGRDVRRHSDGGGTTVAFRVPASAGAPG